MPQKQELVLDLMNNKEILEQRRKELQDIHKTSAMIKDTTEQMKQDLYKQGEILTNVEDNVFKTQIIKIILSTKIIKIILLTKIIIII